MDKEMLARLASKTGQVQFNGPKFPSIKLDGSGTGETAGMFLMYKDKENTTLGNKLKIRILRVRKMLSGYVEENGADASYSSTEYDSPKHDVISLWRRSGGDSKMVAEDTAYNLREKHALKTTSVIYCLLADELVKLNVKGSSVAGDNGLYTYLDNLKDNKLNAFEVETLVTVKKKAKNRAVSYHFAEFAMSDKLEDGYELVESSLDLIQQTIDSKKSKPTERKVVVVSDDEDTSDETELSVGDTFDTF